jgi:hypothetical protein
MLTGWSGQLRIGLEDTWKSREDLRRRGGLNPVVRGNRTKGPQSGCLDYAQGQPKPMNSVGLDQWRTRSRATQ